LSVGASLYCVSNKYDKDQSVRLLRLTDRFACIKPATHGLSAISKNQQRMSAIPYVARTTLA